MYWNGPGNSYVICNPRTKQWVSIPPRRSNKSKHVRTFLVCEPYCSFDNSQARFCMQNSYRYRVFSIPVDETSSGKPKLNGFKSETGRWKKLSLYCPSYRETIMLDHSPTLSNAPPTMCNGNVHLLELWDVIVAFDPFAEGAVAHCRVIDLPHGVSLKANETHSGLGTCLGSLLFCTADWIDSETPLLKVWELKDYDKGEWCLTHEFPLMGFLTYDLSHQVVLFFHPYDRDIMYIDRSSCMLECNLRTRTLQVVNQYQEEATSTSGTNGGLGVRTYASSRYQIFLSWWPTPVHAVT